MGGETDEAGGRRRYLAKQDNVEGTVIRIEEIGEGMAEVEVKNELPFEATARAILAIEAVEGVTVARGRWRNWWRRVAGTKGEVGGRRVPLELDAEVLDGESGRGEVTIPLCLACGMPSTSDADRSWVESAMGYGCT